MSKINNVANIVQMADSTILDSHGSLSLAFYILTQPASPPLKKVRHFVIISF